MIKVEKPSPSAPLDASLVLRTINYIYFVYLFIFRMQFHFVDITTKNRKNERTSEKGRERKNRLSWRRQFYIFFLFCCPIEIDNLFRRLFGNKIKFKCTEQQSCVRSKKKSFSYCCFVANKFIIRKCTRISLVGNMSAWENIIVWCECVLAKR